LDACLRDRAALERDLTTFRYVVTRYERMLDCPEVADFTPPDPRSPVVPLANTRGAARLWLAWAASRGLNGDWPGAVAMVQAHIQFSQKLVAGSRGVVGSMIGMALTADGLQVLAEMINQPGFTTELGPGIEAGLPSWGGRELPLRNALLGECLMVQQILRDPDAFQTDAAGPRAVNSVSRFFTYQPNRTEGYIRSWAVGLQAALDQPPFRRPPLPEVVFSGETAWWLQNGYGKSLAETSARCHGTAPAGTSCCWRDPWHWQGDGGDHPAGASPRRRKRTWQPAGGSTSAAAVPAARPASAYSVAENMADDGGDPRRT
jgi:hypothetical protein